jgi:hypothetical protein
MKPIKTKPVFDSNYQTFIKEIPNVLNDDQIDRLVVYANSEQSGLHRRGSKSYHTVANFYTTQVFPFTDELYSLLDIFWEPYKNITFIEPYEIKKYIKGDFFGNHVDVYINLNENVDRKLNMIIQLSDTNDYEGGDLIVAGQVYSRQKGTAIIFPASLFHSITTITNGTRYSLIGHGWGPYTI